MKLKLTIFVVVVLCCLAAVPLLSSKGAAGDTAAAITQLEQDGVKAALANDPSWIQKNVSDDYVGGTSWGVWETKASQLKDAADPANKVASMSINEVKVSPYGENTAIARYATTYDQMHNGEHLARTVLCSDVWMKQGGAWKEVSSHCSVKK